jgi:predicted phosphate transport protein (TIGR00153 family)
MKLSSILSFFVPKDRVFFGLFEELSAVLVEAATVFKELADDREPAKRGDLVKKIHDIEHKADNITHKIFTELSINFITPFDREDIHYLATSLDDIIDYIHGSSNRLVLYNVEKLSPAMVKLAEITLKQAQEIQIAISNMRSMNNVVRIREAIVRINSLENQADDVFDASIANLFLTQTNAVELIKEKELLANMETATDKCEDVANVIESIIIKYA